MPLHAGEIAKSLTGAGEARNNPVEAGRIDIAAVLVDAGAPHRDQRPVPSGAHAVIVLDQIGWHVSGRLVVPENITLLPLPRRSPELNPGRERLAVMRQNWLSNRVFESYDDIVAHCCEPGTSCRTILTHNCPSASANGAWVLIGVGLYKDAAGASYLRLPHLPGSSSEKDLCYVSPRDLALAAGRYR
jgi:hypothetical protein